MVSVGMMVVTSIDDDRVCAIIICATTELTA